MRVRWSRLDWRRAADRVTRRPDDALLDLGQAGKGGAHDLGLSLTGGKVCAGLFDHFGGGRDGELGVVDPARQALDLFVQLAEIFL